MWALKYSCERIVCLHCHSVCHIPFLDLLGCQLIRWELLHVAPPGILLRHVSPRNLKLVFRFHCEVLYIDNGDPIHERHSTCHIRRISLPWYMATIITLSSQIPYKFTACICNHLSEHMKYIYCPLHAPVPGWNWVSLMPKYAMKTAAIFMD